ncbi:MAG: hypothetical protein RLN87_09720 [Parasphingopyxis sp.]
MTMVARLALAFAIAGIAMTPAPAQLRSEQDAVLDNRVQGRAMSLRMIERRVVQQMRGADYLGNPIYFERSNTYRMTFMRDGEVIRVEVDASSGRIRDRSDR